MKRDWSKCYIDGCALIGALQTSVETCLPWLDDDDYDVITSRPGVEARGKISSARQAARESKQEQIALWSPFRWFKLDPTLFSQIRLPNWTKCGSNHLFKLLLQLNELWPARCVCWVGQGWPENRSIIATIMSGLSLSLLVSPSRIASHFQVPAFRAQPAALCSLELAGFEFIMIWLYYKWYWLFLGILYNSSLS